MKKRSQSLESYIKRWLKKYASSKTNGSQRIRVCCEISSDANQLMKPNGNYTRSQLIDAVSQSFETKDIKPPLASDEKKRFRDSTRARRLLRLVKMDKSLVDLAVKHTAAGKRGASLSHLLLLTQIVDAKVRKEILTESITQSTGFRKFKLSIEQRQSAKSQIRPKITINELDALTKDLAPLLKDAASKKFLSTVNCIASGRRLESVEQLGRISKRLATMAATIPKVQESMRRAIDAIR